MSSLWTPDGERRIEPTGAQPSPAQPSPAQPSKDEVIREFEVELLETPVGDVIANHCYGLFQLAALHLGQQPPHLSEAKIAIDALGAVVERLGSALGEAAPTLTEGLAQIRLAYVQIAAAHDTPEDEPA